MSKSLVHLAYGFTDRCNRLQDVRRKEPIIALFTFKGRHFDLSLQTGHHFMTQQRLKTPLKTRVNINELEPVIESPGSSLITARKR